MRTGLALSATAGLLLMGAVPAQAAGWTDETFPDVPEFNASLQTVASDGQTTWALGSAYGSTPHDLKSQAFLRGAEGWEQVPIPNIGEVDMSTMVGPNDVWAAGEQAKVGFGGVAHWDGTKWSKVPVSEAPEGLMHEYQDMTSFAADDVWMAGKNWENSPESPSSGSIQHWDGTAWNHVELPKLDTPKWNLSTIGGTATDDLWALGGSTGNDTTKGIALHWNGQAWKGFPMPTFDGAGNIEFTDVVANGPDDVHAVGTTTFVENNDVVYRHVAVHWNGQEWATSETPDVLGTLHDVTVAGNQLWAFGSERYDGYATRGYALRYEDGTWKKAETPESGSLASGTELANGSLLTVGSTSNPDGGRQVAGWRHEG